MLLLLTRSTLAEWLLCLVVHRHGIGFRGCHGPPGFIAGDLHVHLEQVVETPAAPSPVASRHAICLQVHKSKAVVRFMFHNPDDVRWFRPVELWTKAGRRGRIREPVSGSGEGGWRGWRARQRTD